MTKTKILILGMIIIGLGAGAAAAILRTSGHEKSSGGQPAEPPANIQVKFVHPRKGSLERLCVQPGSVHTFESIELFAKVQGFLKYLKVDRGDFVKKGEVLAIVDVPNLAAQVEHDRATVAKAQAQLMQMKSHVDVATANLTAIEASVIQAEAMRRAAVAWVVYRGAQLERMNQLAKSDSIDKRLYLESIERHKAAVEDELTAKAKIDTAKEDVKTGQAKIEQAEADVIEAQAQIQVAQAELKKSQVNLAFATITAPFDGKVTFRSMNAGDSMNPGDFVRAADGGSDIKPLLTIHRIDRFRVVVLVPDRDVEKIRVGMRAMMKIDALPGRTYYPTVSRLATALDPNTRLMRVELDLFNDADGKIVHGLYGQVSIVLDKGTEQLSIPRSCIVGKVEDGKGSVYVIRSGRAEKIDLKLGMDSGLRVAVKEVLTKGEALTEDDQVIIEPDSDLAGQPEVTAAPWDDSSTIQSTKTEK